MVKSNYTTNPQEWEERLRVMESNYVNHYYDYLNFNIVLNMLDARDNADYDKEQVLKTMLGAYKRGADVYPFIKELQSLL